MMGPPDIIAQGHTAGKLKRLRDLCPQYRVASDALMIAADLGAADDLLSALFVLCRDEAAAYEARQGAIDAMRGRR